MEKREGRPGRVSTVNQPASSISSGCGRDLAGLPVGHEADHQRMGEGPGLAAEVADVGDRDPDLLADLADHRLLQRLAGLHEAGEGAVDAGREMGRAGEEDLVSALDAHDHRRRDAGEVLEAAGGAGARELRRLARRGGCRNGRRSGGCGPTPRSARPGRQASRRPRRARPRDGATRGGPGPRAAPSRPAGPRRTPARRPARLRLGGLGAQPPASPGRPTPPR